MGLFAQWQPQYAQRGVATFPLLIEGKAKKPATKGYDKTGLKGSGQMALKFPDLDAFGFMAGKRNGVTAIDIDAPDDEALLKEALRRYGDTPVIVRTGSGGFHLYYRHGDEGRKIRPDPSTPIDILGGGVLAAPPSKGSSGFYSFIRGTVADLERLPFLRGGADHAEVQQAVTRELIGQGGRNKALMDYLRGQARHTSDLAELIDVARTYADDQLDRTTGHAFTDAEVETVARSVWQWTERKIAEGEYFVGTGKHLTLSHERIDAAMNMGPFAFTLFMHLQRRFGGLSSFYIANDARHDMPGGEWPRRKMQEARKALIDAGLIEETHKACNRFGPAKYKWL